MSPRSLVLPIVLTAFLANALYVEAMEARRTRYFVAGPVEADLISVVDGDTLMVSARPWPQQIISVMVRIRGIDTPEMKSGCEISRQLARKARGVLADALAQSGARLTLSAIDGDKYFGRVVADVGLGDGRDAATLMLATGLARPYDGGRKTRETCS